MLLYAGRELDQDCTGQTLGTINDNVQRIHFFQFYEILDQMIKWLIHDLIGPITVIVRPDILILSTIRFINMYIF
jgi:hypothetical protein